MSRPTMPVRRCQGTEARRAGRSDPEQPGAGLSPLSSRQPVTTEREAEREGVSEDDLCHRNHRRRAGTGDVCPATGCCAGLVV